MRLTYAHVIGLEKQADHLLKAIEADDYQRGLNALNQLRYHAEQMLLPLKPPAPKKAPKKAKPLSEPEAEKSEEVPGA